MHRYPDLLVNAFASIRAWRFATLALAVVASILAVALVYNTLRTPAYLIPYEFASMQGPVKVAPGSKGVHPDYLATVALADLSLITTFHPENISTQYARFLNRTTPELYAAQSVRLTAESQEFAAEKVSQAFHPGKTRVSSEGLVVDVSGWLIRWSGEKEVLRTEVSYRLTYRESRGMLRLDDLTLRR